jgi:multidrug resistance efflux pump
MVAVVAAALALTGSLGGRPAASPDPSAPGVIPDAAVVVAEGRVVPVRGAELAPGAPGIVAQLPVAEGSMVAAGDLLLALDTSAADAELAGAEAAAAAADARVDQAKAAVAQAEASVAAADASVDQAVAARNAARAARDTVPSGASSAVKRQADAEIARATAGIAAANAQLDGARASLTAAQAAVIAVEADAARAAAAVDGARAGREALLIRAPFAGIVVFIDAVAGERVLAGAPIVRVMVPAAGWWFETADLSETSVPRVAAGQAATITVDGLPDAEIAGTVVSVSAFGESRQGDVVFRVRVEPAGEVPDGLRWNMTVTMEIATGN